MNINNITNNKQNPIIQDIKEFLRTGLMPYRLKREINKLPPYEVRLQQEIDKLNMNNKELRLQNLLDYSNLGERFFEKNFESYQVNNNNIKAFETAKKFISNFEIANTDTLAINGSILKKANIPTEDLAFNMSFKLIFEIIVVIIVNMAIMA